MEFKSIVDYNDHLVNTATRVSVLDYLKIFIRIEGGLELDFVSKLHELVRRTDYCVPHTLLVDFGVIVEKDASYVTGLIMRQNGFVEGRDYLHRNVSVQYASGVKHSKKYFLRPRTFKIVLMRSKHCQHFAAYYAQLEEALVHYNDYQLALEREYIVNFRKRHEEVVKAKDGKIECLEDVIRRLEANIASGRQEMRSGLNEVKEQNVGLKADIKEVKDQNIGLQTALTEVKAKVTEVADEVATVAASLEEAVAFAAPPPTNHLAAENLTVVRLGYTVQPSPTGRGTVLRDSYQVIRRQTASLNSEVAKLRKANPGLRVLLDLPGVPNARSLWQRIQERFPVQIVKNKQRPTRFTLAGVTEGEFVAGAREVYEEPARHYGTVTDAARSRVQAIVETVTNQVIATLTDADFEAIGI